MRQISNVNTIVVITTVCFGSVSAFLTLHPSLSRRSHHSSSHREHDNGCCRRSVRARVPTSGNAYAATATAAFNTIRENRKLENPAAFLAMIQGVDADETPESPADSGVIIENAESKAAKLNAFAAELRAQVIPPASSPSHPMRHLNEGHLTLVCCVARHDSYRYLASLTIARCDLSVYTGLQRMTDGRHPTRRTTIPG